MSISAINLKYFKLEEFDSPDEPGSGSKMHPEFLEKLDYARHNAGIPFKVNSGYRTYEWNLKVKGRVSSTHLHGVACDLAYKGSRERFLIIQALLAVGINRIGIAQNFIHCDCSQLSNVSKNKDEDVIWLYN